MTAVQGVQSSVSIVVPALNEAEHLERVVCEILRTLGDRPSEIIIVDDGSTDDTGVIADRLAAAEPRVSVIHNPVNRGIGNGYWTGVAHAKCDYVTLIPGDGEFPSASIRTVVEEAGSADLVLTYFYNGYIRSKRRRILSNAFTLIVNKLFGLRIMYYNGATIARTDLVRSVRPTGNDFAYMACLVVKLLRRGCTYRQVAIALQRRAGGDSKALSWRNLLLVCKSIAKLWLELNLAGTG